MVKLILDCEYACHKNSKLKGSKEQILASMNNDIYSFSDIAKETGLTQVNVAAIYYNEQDNDQGGKTVTIGKVAPTT